MGGKGKGGEREGEREEGGGKRVLREGGGRGRGGEGGGGRGRKGKLKSSGSEVEMMWELGRQRKSVGRGA